MPRRGRGHCARRRPGSSFAGLAGAPGRGAADLEDARRADRAGAGGTLRRFYPHPRDIGETIELVGLADKRKARAHKLSGGQLRRLDVALAIVGDPDLMFLDEPTTGFDPAGSLGAGRGLARAGQDGLFDHAQHGRGRGARRPSGSDREGFHRRSRRVPSSPRAPPRPWAAATSRPWRSASPTLLGRRLRCLRT